MLSVRVFYPCNENIAHGPVGTSDSFIGGPMVYLVFSALDFFSPCPRFFLGGV